MHKISITSAIEAEEADEAEKGLIWRMRGRHHHNEDTAGISCHVTNSRREGASL